MAEGLMGKEMAAQEPRTKEMVLKTLRERARRTEQALDTINNAIEALETSNDAGRVLDLLRLAGIRL
jgi:hypothetical protein